MEPSQPSSAVELIYQQIEDLVADTNHAGYSLREPEGVEHLLRAAIAWDYTVKDPLIEGLIQKYFYPRIIELTGIDPEALYDAAHKYKTERRQHDRNSTILQGLSNATNLILRNQYDDASEVLADSLFRAEALRSERPLSPISSVAEKLDWLRADLARTQGLRHIGMVQKTIPALDDATGGFQGLNLITAKSGEGKTMLVTQVALDILEDREDVCCLFVSMDMIYDTLMRRFITNRSRLPFNVVRSGSTERGWTEQERAEIERGMLSLQSLGQRIEVLDRFNFPIVTRSNIMRQARRLQERTGCENIIILVDFIELTPAPDVVREKDEWVIEEYRTIADLLGNNGFVFGIAESGKSETAYARGTAANIKGSYRKVMRADCVITLNSFDEQELLNNWDINEATGYLSYRAEAGPYEFKPAEAKKAGARAARIRKTLQERGEAPIMLKIDKARDGAKKVEINIMNYFQRNYFLPLEIKR